MSQMLCTIQTFNDGVLKVYSLSRKTDGSEELTLKHRLLRYEERTVGVNRYYRAAQENVRITKVLRVQKLKNISTQDVVILESGEQYYVRRAVDPKNNVNPPCWDLSLERVTHDIDIK